jgi:alpha-galactosidase
MSSQEVNVHDELVLSPANGWVRFLRHGKVLLDRASASVAYTAHGGEHRVMSLAGHRVSYGLARDSVNLSIADAQLELTWHITVGDEMRLRLEATNVGVQPVSIDEMHVLDLSAESGGSLALRTPPKNWRFFQNGWQSWTPTYARHLDDGIWINPNTEDYLTKHEPHTLSEDPKTYGSEWFTVIAPNEQPGSLRSDPSLLLGFVTTADQLGEIRLELANGLRLQALRAVSYADGLPLAPGEKATSETLLLATRSDPLALLERYATRLGETMHARSKAADWGGWCTWYHFYGEDTADDVAANLGVMEKERLPLDLVLIDDGYETAMGDWREVDAAKYPGGMKDIADRIRAAGRHPGIWTAPFAVSSESKLFAEHPDWVLRDETDQPVLAFQHWGKDIYGLDLSLPAVCDWLRALFHTLSDEWGYEFFKVDFLYTAALARAKRQDPNVTRARAVRRGLEIIREAVGAKFVLGCGAPLGPAVGLVDGMRIGSDVHVEWRPFWPDLSAPSVSNAMLNSVTRAFMHRRLWLNDPDCLLLRPRGPNSNLSANETRFLASVAGISGGLVLDSDHLPELPPERLDTLRRVLPPYERCALPADLFLHERPQTLVLPIEVDWGSWTIVALLNWDDESRSTTLDLAQVGLAPGAYHVYNYWRQQYMGTVRDQVLIEKHQAHEAVVLLLKRVSDKPQLLTSTFHILQGAVEVKAVRAENKHMTVELQKRGQQAGRLLFALPEGQEIAKLMVNGRLRKPGLVTPGIWQTNFELNDKATVELLFS